MPSFGETLRRERELRQISLREISESTKINLRYLDALERDDFRHLPGGVFNKGFVRAYAQYIGVDAEQMVNAYLAEETRQSARIEEKAAAAQVRTGHRPIAAMSDARPRAETGHRNLAIAAIALAILLLVSVVGFAWVYRGSVASFLQGLRGSPANQESAP